MSEPRDGDLSADDRTRLDELFGQVVEALTDGRDVDLEGLLAGRSDLLPRAEELLEIARKVAVRRPVEAPRFAGYEILSELGRGGMGRVYRARHLELDRVVALKTLPAQWLTGGRATARFEREARAVARLQHPGIVPIFEVGESEGVPYFTMEYVEGRTLAGVLDGLRGLGLDSHHLRAESVGPEGLRAGSASYVKLAARICRDVARALAHAHAEGVVHRDVKPSNILLRTDGTPLLFDFGLATLEGGALEETLTSSGEFLGTPHYVSPEQAAGRPLSASTDLFSLGATLYELLTLERPFRGVTTQEILRAVQEHEPRSPLRLNREVPRDLATICQAAMAKEPGRRYASAAALADDLDAFLDGRPVSARALGPLGRGLRLVRRHPAPAAAVVLGTLLLLGTPTALYLQQRAANVEIQGALDAAEDSRLEAVAARERAEEERDIAREVTAVLEHMFDGVTPENGGKDARIFDALGELADEVRDLRPVVRAPLERTLGNSYLTLTLYDEAREHLEAARATYEGLPMLHAPELLGVRADLTSLTMHLGDHEAALEETAALLEAYRAADLVNRDRIHVEANHANALAFLGHLDEARDFLEETLAGYADVPLGPEGEALPSWVLQHSLALIEANLGDHDASLALLRPLHATLVAEHGEEHPDAVSVLILWSQVAKEAGDLEVATETGERALAASLATFGEEALTTVTVAHNLAGLWRAKGNLERALAQEQRAAELADRALPEAHPLHGYIHEVRSTILSELGRDEEALAAQRRSFDVRLELHGEANPQTLTARLFLARRLVAVGDEPGAEQQLRAAIEQLPETPGASEVLVRVLHEDLDILVGGQGPVPSPR